MSRPTAPDSDKGLVPEGGRELVPGENLTPEVLKDMVEFLSKESHIRQQELELRREELSIRKEQVHNAHEFSMESLRLQAQDFQDERSHQSRSFNQRNGFGIAFLLILIGFTIFLLQSNHEELAREIMKAIGFFAAGGLSGYGYASFRKKDKPEPLPSPDEER